MTETTNRYAIFLLSVVLLTVVLTACGDNEASFTVPVGVEAGDLVDRHACTFEAADVEYAADCGTLVVPENRGDPNSRLIALPVIRVISLNEYPAEPLFKFAGGPGNSNMGFSLVPWFIENHDIVLIGYRGIDGSVVLDCPEVSNLFRNSRGDMLSEAVLDEISMTFSSCAERLANEGIDIDGYNAAEIIEDMEAARKALGYEQVNLSSWSWGTTLARLYADMYPDSIYRSAMISVDTPRAIIHEPQEVDALIEYYADLCAQDADCSARTDDLAETMREVSQDMPERWWFFRINPGLVKIATYNFFESPASAAQIIDVWLSAAEGDPSGMAALTLVGPYIFANASNWGHNAAIRSSMGQFDPARDYFAELNPPDSIIGSPVTTLSYAEYAAWPGKRIPEEFRQVQPSNVETLLVSGSIDFDTPAQYARDELLPSLSNGQQVILSEYGHVSYILTHQPEALDHVLTSFYNTGVADDSLYDYKAVNFNVGFSYPEQAKLALAIIVLVPMGLVVLVWVIVRKVRHRKTI
jgi:pimeloyl-ACP methyl ester carboxylesterase